ncbi:hypothetical protein [Sulfurospirillum barnesii]|uniref:Transformation system protein n=1 Tax=Sulfurospirillum barnesii (strain ATCC 700032 / DSM 10660 / SES-3) TaxID=760154 RepID=I3XX46_SULBS|nr:hypothetical protein [Sulfurospirillum barnesii]AFL68520.1 hypothetical protein Sulba_1226 [Sulfurospirillum barnesii SES-3]
MLNAHEIAELEKRVFRYRFKQKLRPILGLSVLAISTYIIFYFFLCVDTQKDETPPPYESNLSTHSALPLLPLVSEKKQPLLLQLPRVETNVSHVTMQETRISNIPLPKDDFSNDPKEEKWLDTTLLPPPLMNENKEKSVIHIETKDVDTIQYLKERFDKTHNVVFALMLCEEYYKNKNYSESNKWALIANNLDAENEKSWIFFAKSKFKLGHKEDAQGALKAYLKNHKSKAAESLLQQMSIGASIE